MSLATESQLPPVATATTCADNNDDNDGEYDLHDDDDDDDEYPHLFQSVRSSTGLEIGVRVTWPGVKPIELSTCLPSEEIAPMFHGTQWYVAYVVCCCVLRLLRET